MSETIYDLFVIGAGSGGVRAARMSAGFGAKVAIAESRYLGGTCVNVGCVPKKLFSYAAHYGEDFSDAKGFGWDSSVSALDWPRLRDNKTKEIERLNGIYGRLLTNAGVDLINGHASIVDATTVAIDGVHYKAKRILIAVGGWPFIPNIPGRELAISSNELFYLDTLPKHAVVVGGGYIATEFAGILHGLGVNVEQIYRKDLFLRGFDTEIRAQLADEMTAKGVKLRFNENVTAIAEQDGQFLVSLESGETLLTDKVLYATGRKPLLEGLGLENTEVQLNDKGYIAVDQGFQTSEPSIYAVGDVIGGMELTPVALAEGMNLARRLFKDDQRILDYNYIPTAIFSSPNLATVGLSEEEARERYDNISVFTSRFSHLKHTLSGNQTKTFLKLIVDNETDKVIGAHMMGDDSGEIIQGLAVAIKAGATKADFDSTIGIHPTVAEEFVTMREASR
ncbi:Glutathione amide reductase [Zhongshania aliphaticivorans]|uniref:Glutathione amide reductase n=1 Tax=Zhongshania aliphaticivorans TaxID=1470434 RepID=A0A5S9NWP8_9GAMM|nr:glutathione-disulfide reductase [Zhongshania aliphaticivorans]CAA0088824.1 Glutathione amide reductase [Zhongshania aliphaticivorans]CAA0095216.1 Glutathione amide reductase [Zhongshania aliphaticivorans]